MGCDLGGVDKRGFILKILSEAGFVLKCIDRGFGRAKEIAGIYQQSASDVWDQRAG